MKDRNLTTSEARHVAKQLFLGLFPGQDTWFDLAWAAYPRIHVAPSSSAPTEMLRGLGVADTADPLTVKMAKQFVPLAATFLIHSPTGCEELLKRLRKEGQQLGHVEPVIDWLVQSAEKEIGLLSSRSQVIINRLWRGELLRDQPAIYEDVPRLTQGREHDVTVDEHDHICQIPKSSCREPREILSLRKMQRGMLWLVLSNAGDYIDHQQIGELFGFEATYGLPTEKQKVDARVYQYPIELRRLVDEALHGKMIKPGANRVYLVPKNGWSFLWIRKESDLRKSELIRGIGL